MDACHPTFAAFSGSACLAARDRDVGRTHPTSSYSILDTAIAQTQHQQQHKCPNWSMTAGAALRASSAGPDRHGLRSRRSMCCWGGQIISRLSLAVPWTNNDDDPRTCTHSLPAHRAGTASCLVLEILVPARVTRFLSPCQLSVKTVKKKAFQSPSRDVAAATCATTGA